MTGQLKSHFTKVFPQPWGNMYILDTPERLENPMSCLFLHRPKAHGSETVKGKVIHSVGVTMNFKNLSKISRSSFKSTKNTVERRAR